MVWNIFPYIGNFIIPTDCHIFQRSWNHQPVLILYIVLYIILIVQLIVYDDLSEVNHWKWWVMLPQSPSGWETAFFLPSFFFSLRRHRQLFVSEPGPQMFGNGPNPSKSSWEGETWSILGGILGDWVDLEAPKNIKTTWGDSSKIGSAVYRADVC